VPDLRAVALGVGAWTGALLVLVAPGWPALAAVALVVALVGTGVVRGWWSLGWLGPLGALVAVAGVAALQHVLLTTSPLAALAEEGAVVGGEV
jgi:competence protein ComEC